MSRKREEETPIVVPETDGAEMEHDSSPQSGAQEQAQPPESEPKPEAEKTYTLTAEEFETAKAHIAKLQKEKDETVNLLQRNQADFENFRRRNAAVRADSYEEGKRDCIKLLLPAIDNFDRALDNENASDGNWREGVRLAVRQLHELMEKQGLSEIDAAGQFDPNVHEAVMQEKVEGKQKGEILMVLQKGYRVGDRIIRHSMVKVAE